MNENIEVKILTTASSARAMYAVGGVSAVNQKAGQIVREKLLIPAHREYLKAQASVKYDAAGKPAFIDAYLLRKNVYTADAVRLSLGADFQVTSYDAVSGAEEEVEIPIPTQPPQYAPADAVFGTPVPEIPTALAGVQRAAQIAAAAGLRVVTLLGPNANVANYRAYLSSHLRAFGNIGHGYTGGIVLADGNLTSAWFSSLPSTALSSEVIYFNSCQTFNPPLLPSIVGAGARTFIGGIINLLIGPSEEVFKCFWAKVITNRLPMGPSLPDCEISTGYPDAGAHGFAGDAGLF